MPLSTPAMASSQMPPTDEQAGVDVRVRVPEAAGEAAGDGVHAGGAGEVGGGDQERAAAGRLQVVQRAAELAAERGEGAGLEAQLPRASPPAPARPARPPRRARRRRRRARRRAWGPALARRGGRGRPRAAARARPPSAGPACTCARTACSAVQKQRSLTACPSGPAQARSAGSQVGSSTSAPVAAAQLRERLVEALGAELVPGAVAGLALHAVAPALVRAVDDRRRLAGAQRERVPLRRHDLLEVVPVGHVDDVPVVQVEELARVPLHVVAGHVAVAAHVVGVDRRLVPVEVHDDVVRATPSRPRRALRPRGRASARPRPP